MEYQEVSKQDIEDINVSPRVYYILRTRQRCCGKELWVILYVHMYIEYIPLSPWDDGIVSPR